MSRLPYNDIFLFVFYAFLGIEKTKRVSLCTQLSFCNWDWNLRSPPNYVEAETHNPVETVLISISCFHLIIINLNIQNAA